MFSFLMLSSNYPPPNRTRATTLTVYWQIVAVEMRCIPDLKVEITGVEREEVADLAARSPKCPTIPTTSDARNPRCPRHPHHISPVRCYILLDVNIDDGIWMSSWDVLKSKICGHPFYNVCMYRPF